MSMVRLFLLCLVSVVVSVRAGEVVPYNDLSRINEQKYKFSSEDRLVSGSKATPEWPYYGRLFKTSSHGRCEFSLSSAHDGFSPLGDVGNSAVAWFKKNPVQLRDICSFARLVEQNQAIYFVDRLSNVVETPEVAFASTEDNLLRYLAGHDILFDANTQKQQISFKYARSCWDDLFYIGFELGLVRTAQSLEMKSALTSSEAALFAGKCYSIKTNASVLPDSLQAFPDGLLSVFNKLLAEKSLSNDLNDEAILVGDTKFFINIPLKIEAINAASLALYISIPSPQHYNNTKIIQAFVGEPYSGLGVGASTGFAWNISSLINLHFFNIRHKWYGWRDLNPHALRR